MTVLFFGMLHGWSVASPWSGQAIWWLQLLALAYLVGKLAFADSLKAAFKTSALFGLAWFASSMWWLYTSMHTYGGLPAPLAALGVLALSSWLASFYAAAGAAFAWLKSSDDKPFQNAALFAALWLLAELLRGTVMTGLPWSAAGYAHIDGPLISAAPWIGVYGISSLAAFIAALFILTRSCGLKLLIIIVLCIKAGGAPALEANTDKASDGTPSAGLTVRLLQGNIPQNEKFDGTTGVQVALNWYGERLKSAVSDGVDLVVAPETAIPLLPRQMPANYWSSLQASFNDQKEKSRKTAALIGIALGDMQSGYTNSAVSLEAGASPASVQAYRYDKHHLVPFGEFIPPLFRWFTDMMNIPLGDFSRGDLAQASFAHAGERFAVNICYEDLFGEELARRFTNPATAPTVFVNISNMGWFGDGMAIDQHLNISRMRAVEFNRPVIRATNTGSTTIIDHRGVTLQALPRSTRGMLNGTVVGKTELTPYAKWTSKYGLKPLWVLACGLIALAILRRKYNPNL